jgi:hypothetical protein
MDAVVQKCAVIAIASIGADRAEPEARLVKPRLA